ncbi:MAG: hypothetical protein KUG78_00395 [Kangiellaceae bacterium]|nr:hypothetical protein [Kangiellaceae bacterium]
MNLYFDDIEIGTTEKTGPYELSKEEIIDFAKKYDPEQFHTSDAAARASIYGGLVASSSHMLPIAYSLSHLSKNRPLILAPLEIGELQFPNPARPGDKLFYTYKVLEKTPSKSKPDRGIIKFHIKLSNEGGTLVLDYKHTLLVKRSTQIL